MNQRIIKKEDLRELHLILDTLWPELIEKWKSTLPVHIQVHRISDSEIRRRVIYELNLYTELKKYGFDYPISLIKAALLTRKMYKHGCRFPSKQTLRKWFNTGRIRDLSSVGK